MKLQSLALVFLAFALAVASADTALETSDADVDNHVDGELTEQELDREDDEPLQEDEDDDDLDLESLGDDRELDDSISEEEDGDDDLDRSTVIRTKKIRSKKRVTRRLRRGRRAYRRRTCRKYRRGLRVIRRCRVVVVRRRWSRCRSTRCRVHRAYMRGLRRGISRGLRRARFTRCGRSANSARITGRLQIVQRGSSSRMIMWRIRRAVSMALRRERRTLMNGIRKIMRRRSKEAKSCYRVTKDMRSLVHRTCNVRYIERDIYRRTRRTRRTWRRTRWIG